MGSEIVPLKVVVLEDDAFARISLEKLLRRDLRTEVIAAFSRPRQLLRWTEERSGRELPHVFVIDAEYERRPHLTELLVRLQERGAHRTILLLSQYGGDELIRLAARLQLDGLVLKREIGLAVATGVYLAHSAPPVYSSALEPSLETMAVEPAVRTWWHRGRRLPRWRLLPGLSERQQEIAWHCLIYGMSAQLTGEEIALAKDSVHKYHSHLYDKIERYAPRELDLDPLKPVIHRLYRSDPHKPDKRSRGSEDHADGQYRTSAGEEEHRRDAIYVGDEWAFHFLTQLPRRDAARRSTKML